MPKNRVCFKIAVATVYCLLNNTCSLFSSDQHKSEPWFFSHLLIHLEQESDKSSTNIFSPLWYDCKKMRKFEYTWNMKSHKALTGIDLCKNHFIRLSDIAMYPGTLRSDREPNKCKGKMRWRIEGLFCNFLLPKRSSIIPTWSRWMVIFMVEKLKLWPIRIWKLLQKYYIQRDFANLSPAMALCWNSGST